MLYFILLLCAYSAHEGLTSFHHEEAEGNPILFSGVESINVDSVVGLPKFVRLKFYWNSRQFALNLSRTDKWDNFKRHYTVLENGSSDVDGDAIDGVVMFPSGKVSEVFEAYLHSDGVRYEFKPSYRQESLTLRKLYQTIGNSTRFMASRRRLINEFENCWPGQQNTIRQTGIGYIVDPDFVAAAVNKRAGDVGTNAEKVQAEVAEINAEMNTIYRAQFGIVMELEEVWDQQGLFPTRQFPTENTQGVQGGFTLGCGVYGEAAGKLGIETYLERLQLWRQINKPQTFGDWQMLTDCFPPPGTIGIAYVRAVCTEYGVGVNTFTNSGDSQTWLTVAHEVGHNIGAGHSFELGQGQTGGIMDYGDGKIAGEYQFNEQFRFNDICGTLQATMAGAGTVQNCWTARGPQGPGEVAYEWTRAQGNSISECLPLRSRFPFQTTLYECQQLTGVANGEPATAPVADSTLCDVSDKPIDLDSHQYFGGCEQTHTDVTCGNGILEPTEQCEQALLPDAVSQACCTNQCVWSNTAACSVHKHSVDATFLYANSLYIFQGDQVFKYTGGANVKAWNAALDEGYPRPITTAFPGLANAPDYSSDIQSALVKPGSSELLIFKAFTAAGGTSQMNALRYDLTANAAIGTIDITALSSSMFVDCGTVSASMAFTESMWLMCDSLIQKMTYAPAFIGLSFVPDYDFQFRDEILTEIEAAFHDTSTGESVFYNGGYTTRWQARTHVGTPQRVAGLYNGGPTVVDPANPTGEGGGVPGSGPTSDGNPTVPPPNSQCADLCRTCNPEAPNICTSCRTIPTTPLAGGYCLQDNVVTYLGFDTNSNADAEFVKGGQAGLNAVGDRYVRGLGATIGDISQTGLSFDGTEKLGMADFNAKGVTWGAFEKLYIEAWFNPSPVSLDAVGNLPRQRFVTIKDTNGFPLTTIDFYVEPRCVPPEIADTNCACIEKTGRFNQPFPAECHNGAEFGIDATGRIIQQPYCYVSNSCNIAGRTFDGYEYVSGVGLETPTLTGNRILLCDGADCQLSDPSSPDQQASVKQFKLGVKTPTNEFNCFVNAPLQVGQWNKLYFELGNNIFVTGVGGLRHRRAFVNTAGNRQNTFQIGEWEIGADQGGIIGTLDHFQMSIGEPSGLAAGNEIGGGEDGGSAGTMTAVVIPLILIILIAVACYYYKDEISGQFEKWSDDPPMKDQGSLEHGVPMAPVARDLSAPTRKPGMSFDYSRTENTVEWYYVENGEQVGPFAEAIFNSRIGTQVHENTLVWNGTTVESWVAASEVPELQEKFYGPGSETLWNYVGPNGDNIGPIPERDLIKLRLPGDTYIWNGTTVNEWTYLSNTYLAGKRV